MSELIQIFMRRDGMSLAEATEYVNELRERVLEGEDPEDVLYEEGLEPDYVLDLI